MKDNHEKDTIKATLKKEWFYYAYLKQESGSIKLTDLFTNSDYNLSLLFPLIKKVLKKMLCDTSERHCASSSIRCVRGGGSKNIML